MVLLVPVGEQLLLFPYNYTYVNAVAGVGGIDGRWESDYWRAAGQEAITSVPRGADLRCSALVQPSRGPAADLWPCGTDVATFEHRRGEAVSDGTDHLEDLWVIGRRRADNHSPDGCESVDDVTHAALHRDPGLAMTTRTSPCWSPSLTRSARSEQLTTEIAPALDRLDAQGRAERAWEPIGKLSEQDPRVRGLRLRRNCGKSMALAAGVEVATGWIIATLDGDLQDDPAELPGMLARLEDGANLVAGHKVDRKDPLAKRVPSKLFNLVTGLVTGLKLRDHNRGLKVARREVFDHVPLYGERHRYFASIAHAQGFAVVEQPVTYRRRPAHLFGGTGRLMGCSASCSRG